MRNKKGFIPVPFVVLGFWGMFAVVGIMAAWHIPAWSKAKAAGCEEAYQAGNMQCGK